MTVRHSTQVGIVGAGPAGLLLSHLLALGGVDSIVVESRSRAYSEARQWAGMLESTTVELLRAVGLGDRLDAEGLEHDGIYLQFAGERHHLNFRELTGGRCVTIYPQTEIVKDLIAARLAAAAALEFQVSNTALADLDSDRPTLRYTDSVGERHEVSCEAIAGCDGFYGVCRPSIPPGLGTVHERRFPYAWLGILAAAPPSTDEVIYCRHDNGFALHSMRTSQLGRLYLQVRAGDDIARWPDDRVWEKLSLRLATPGWELQVGPVMEKNITPMRGFVFEPMQYRRLFLAGDAAHIVPPTGARGLNLAIADVAALATALIRLLRDGRGELAEAYSSHCLGTDLAGHRAVLLDDVNDVVLPGQDPFESATACTAAHFGQLALRCSHARRELHRRRAGVLRPVYPARAGCPVCLLGRGAVEIAESR